MIYCVGQYIQCIERNGNTGGLNTVSDRAIMKNKVKSYSRRHMKRFRCSLQRDKEKLEQDTEACIEYCLRNKIYQFVGMK